MTLIHYATPMIATAAEEIARVAAQTEANHQQSIAIVTSNRENFDGTAAMSFQDAIAVVNHAYEQSKEAIRAAGIALTQANDDMTHANAMLASQY